MGTKQPIDDFEGVQAVLEDISGMVLYLPIDDKLMAAVRQFATIVCHHFVDNIEIICDRSNNKRKTIDNGELHIKAKIYQDGEVYEIISISGPGKFLIKKNW